MAWNVQNGGIVLEQPFLDIESRNAYFSSDFSRNLEGFDIDDT